MGQRLDLQAILLTLMPENDKNVYFQPGINVNMDFPCIRYQRDFVLNEHADNESYMKTNRYLVTVIDRNADSEIPSRVEDLPMCTFERFYVADGLNHNVYKLFF